MFIHQRNDWPKLHWDSASLAYPLASLRFHQGHHLGRTESIPLILRDEALSKFLTTEVIRSSEIDGINLSPNAVLSSGAAKLMLDAIACYSNSLTLERLFDWHSDLSTQGTRHNQRIFRVNLHENAPPPSRIPHEMELFLHWFNKDGNLDPVLKAGVAYFWFLAIQPFSDGNGYIARAIANLRLARSEKSSDRFYSLSRQIRLNQESHDQILAQTLHGDTNITPWLHWFLETLRAAIDEAENILAPLLAKARFQEKLRNLDLTPRQRSILNRLSNDTTSPLTSTSYAVLANTSHDTATRDIHKLIQKGVLQPSPARGRSSSYSLILDK